MIVNNKQQMTTLKKLDLKAESKLILPLLLLTSIYCTTAVLSIVSSSTDFCPELSKIKILKMLDSQTKSATDSNNLQVQH